MKTIPRAAVAASWIQSVTVLAILVISAPAALLAALGIVSDPDWHYAALTIGILVVSGLGATVLFRRRAH